MAKDSERRKEEKEKEKEEKRGGKGLVFFFQAEDGIRARLVTGVQSVLFRSMISTMMEIWNTYLEQNQWA